MDINGFHFGPISLGSYFYQVNKQSVVFLLIFIIFISGYLLLISFPIGIARILLAFGSAILFHPLVAFIALIFSLLGAFLRITWDGFIFVLVLRPR